MPRPAPTYDRAIQPELTAIREQLDSMRSDMAATRQSTEEQGAGTSDGHTAMLARLDAVTAAVVALEASNETQSAVTVSAVNDVDVNVQAVVTAVVTLQTTLVAAIAAQTTALEAKLDAVGGL